jgi:hypothetical protein
VGHGGRPRNLPETHRDSRNPSHHISLSSLLSLNPRIWQGVTMDSLKFHPGLPCPTLVRPMGVPPLKQPYGRFRGGSLAGQTFCSCLLPPRKPHAIRLCSWGHHLDIVRHISCHVTSRCFMTSLTAADQGAGVYQPIWDF